MLLNCPMEPLTVSASTSDQQVQLDNVDPRRGAIELRLPPTGAEPTPSIRIRGRVVGPDGRPVTGAKASAIAVPADRRCEQFTQADGVFALGPIRPGTWQIWVSHPRFPTVDCGARELVANAVVELGDVRFVDGGTALVRVQGAPPGADLRFSIRQAGSRWSYFAWQRISEQVLRSAVLAPAEYLAVLQVDGFALRCVPFVVRAGEEVEVTARLEPGVRQRFEFVRADGARVSSKLLHAVFRGQQVVIARSLVCWQTAPVHAADGAMFADIWLAPGDYRIEAADQGAEAAAAFRVGAAEGPPLRMLLR